MNRISIGFLASSLFFVAACGSSSGDSNGNAQCKTPAADNKLTLIRIPGSSTPPANNNTPNVPNAPDAGTNPATTEPNNCNNANPMPGNLGGTPTNGTPVANGPTGNPTFPGSNPNAGGNRAPALDVTPLLGVWEFQAAYCENGSVTPVLQRLNDMHMNNDFYVTLTITRSSLEEFRWVKLEDPASRSPMMCTIKQSSTYSSNGPTFFRVSTSAATYDDAGGIVKCNLGSEPAAVYEQVGLYAGGDALVRTIAKSPECDGMTMIQSFEKRRQ